MNDSLNIHCDLSHTSEHMPRLHPLPKMPFPLFCTSQHQLIFRMWSKCLFLQEDFQ